MKVIGLILTAVVLIGVVAAWLWYAQARRAHSTTERFRMPIDDAFAINSPGKVVVVGVVAEGEVRPGANLLLQTERGDLPVVVEAMEAYHQPIQVARQSDRVGIMIIGVDKSHVAPGSVIVSPASRLD